MVRCCDEKRCCTDKFNRTLLTPLRTGINNYDVILLQSRLLSCCPICMAPISRISRFLHWLNRIPYMVFKPSTFHLLTRTVKILGCWFSELLDSTTATKFLNIGTGSGIAILCIHRQGRTRISPHHQAVSFQKWLQLAFRSSVPAYGYRTPCFTCLDLHQFVIFLCSYADHTATFIFYAFHILVRS